MTTAHLEPKMAKAFAIWIYADHIILKDDGKAVHSLAIYAETHLAHPGTKPPKANGPQVVSGPGQLCPAPSPVGQDGCAGADSDTCRDSADSTWIVDGNIVIDVVDQDCPMIEMCVFDLCGICILPAALGVFVRLLGLEGLLVLQR